jgi:hypothetical protein
MKSNSHPASPPKFQLVLVCVAFMLGIALTGIWFHQHQTVSKSDGLSASTKKLLDQLPAPVTIHYYALLPAGSADAALQAFAGRVAQLLGALQNASGGKLTLASFDAPAETNSAAASADGLQPFNLDKGDACFLGLVIASGKNTETFTRLSPEWEAALEFDLARAIQRVAVVAAPPKPAPEVAKPSPQIVATINRLIPDAGAVSMQQADDLFHDDYVKRCGEVGAELETQMSAAQQQVVAAQSNGSPADLAAARKNLLSVQLAQAEKLKALAADLSTQLAVFQRMKSGVTNDAK